MGKVVSVIIPAYNAQKHIDDCLDSVVLNCKDPFEVIVVNDGSQDKTGIICEEYISAHPKVNIRLINQENAGVSVARNRGIAEATGEWIVFLDADDCLLPGMFRVIEKADTAAIDVIMGELSWELSPDVGENYYAEEVDPMLLARCCLRYAKYSKEVRKKYRIDPYSNWSSCAKLYRREWLQKNAIRFPEGIFTSEDFAFLLQAFTKKPRVLGTNVKMYYYRTNDQSVTHTFNPQIFENYCKLFDYLEKCIDLSEYSEDMDAYIAERIVDCIRIYTTHHDKSTKDFLRQKLQVFYSCGAIQRVLRCPLSNIFVGKKRRIIGTYWLLRIKLDFWISRKKQSL